MSSRSHALSSSGGVSQTVILQKHACSICSKRKIKCDRQDPCSACLRSKTPCTFQEPAPSMRHRKRLAEEELLARLNQYEDLLRANNVNFEPYDSGWIPSNFQSKMAVEQSTCPSTPAPVPAAMTKTVQRDKIGDRSLWADLSSELQNPPQHRLPIRTLDDSTPSSISGSSPNTSTTESNLVMNAMPLSSDLSKLHPKPGHIFRLWQIFLDRVNPLCKVVHSPTLQIQILEASANLTDIPKATEAAMFAIYLLAVTSLGSTECESLFGENKPTLLTKYRNASKSALVAADFIISEDILVLQALALYLASDFESPSVYVLSAVALRIAMKLGYHRADTTSNVSFFEQEMRIRLWWFLHFLDARVRISGPCPVFVTDFVELRLPLNVNDSDLHPDMVEPPKEHVGTSEMLYPLLKYEVQIFRKKVQSQIHPSVLANSEQLIKWSGFRKKDIDELEHLYENKYLQHCDTRIPLHFIALTNARLGVCRIRFLSEHPRNRPDGGAQMLQEENDALFANSIRLIALDNDSRKTKFAPNLLSHMTSRSQLDAFIYMISELRRRTSSDLVSKAWDLVEILYDEHPELIDETENTFYVALGDLTLVAWEARQAELIRERNQPPEELTPQFIKLLVSARQHRTKEKVDLSGAETTNGTSTFSSADQALTQEYRTPIENEVLQPVVESGDEPMPMILGNGEDVDWAYWDQFLEAPTYGL